jgi:proteasome lid subunit RPN8/RPN11
MKKVKGGGALRGQECPDFGDGQARGTYLMAASELKRLRKFAESEQKAAQREVGGLILSNDGVHLKLMFLVNRASRPGQFSIRGADYKSAKDRAKRSGKSVLGTFHSHPISEAIPGERDITNAHAEGSGSLMLIYDVCGREARLWKISKVKGLLPAIELTFTTR